MLDATPLLRLYAHFRRRGLAAQDAAAVQQAQLRRLLDCAAATRFGRDHGFDRIRDVADFRDAVPLRAYEDFWQAYWREAFPHLVDVSWPGTIRNFAVTSGTSTGTTKFIPCSEAMVRSNRKAALDILVHHLAARPRSRVMGGRSFMLGGSTDFVEEAPGIHSGDLSGIAASRIPFWARPYYFPERDLALIADWEAKVEKLAPLSLTRDIRLISGAPSWLLIFFDKLAAAHPSGAWGARHAYPDLEVVVHGGVNFAPYRERFSRWLEGTGAETREVYPASEGFFAVADRGDGDGMRMILDSGLFYEFVPVEELGSDSPTRHWIGDAEIGVDYALVVSTCAGLWAYPVGDTVKLVDRAPPRLLVTGRTSYSLSAFGEHLTGVEIEESVTAAAAAIGETVEDFSVTAIFPAAAGELGRHRYWVEFSGRIPEREALATFTRRLDEALMEENDDYRTHRQGGFGLDPPEVRAVPPGAFAAWMKERGRLGGQNKVPRVVSDRDLAESLDRFMAAV